MPAGDLSAPACASRGLRGVLRAEVEALSRPEGGIPLISSSPRFFETALPVSFGGSSAEAPHAFRWYDKNRIVAGKRLEDHLRFAVFYLPRRRCGAGGRKPEGVDLQSRRHGRDLPGKDGGVEGAAPLGNSEPLLEPPLYGGRGDEPGSGCVRVCGESGARRAGDDAPAWRAELCLVGRP